MTGPGRPELVATELVAVVIAVRSDAPQVLTVGSPGGVAALPAGALRSEHRSLQAGMRAWVQQLTGHQLGFCEQLYTFADRERLGAHQRIISVSYLALAGAEPAGTTPVPGAHWRGLYEFFPLEDRRTDPDGTRAQPVLAALGQWAGAAPVVQAARAGRIESLYAPATWSAEQALARYELAWEARLVPEAHAGRSGGTRPAGAGRELGAPMLHDHRRILATGLSRLRATIQYRPVVFELMPPSFTLRALQECVESISGTRLHTQNFRRLVLGQDLVEPTGEHAPATGGRPARLFRFRREVVRDRAVALALPRPR